MKKIIMFVVAMAIASCAGKEIKQPVEIEPSPETAVKASEKSAPLFGNLLSDVAISTVSINPERGQDVGILFRLAKSAGVTVNIYDPDNCLVKSIKANLTSGKQDVKWDGKDMDGKAVPNEAYYFTIIAQDAEGIKEIYDPTVFSGGIEHAVEEADMDIFNKTLIYDMAETGRVRVRIGIHGGPLLLTLVDWKPRLKGLVTERWGGIKDFSMAETHKHQNFKIVIHYFTFPKNSIVIFGNTSYIYREYKAKVKNRPEKPQRERFVSNTSDHYLQSRVLDRSPEVTTEFLKVIRTDPDGVPVIHGKTIVKIAIKEEDRQVFQGRPFEISTFLDYNYYIEDETGYTPYNWVWNLANVPEGDHLLSVNVSSTSGQVGSYSRKVRIVK